MAANEPKSLQDLISWEFQIGVGGMIARYGQYAGAFYRQYLPGGIAFPAKHPPKKIDPSLYEMAKKQSKK
jgi:hypothetical protein